MPRILITAFEPYDVWSENSSWLTLADFTRELPSSARITTRLYPVDLPAMRERLARDLTEEFDCALHLGQAPGSAAIRFEAIGLNVGGTSRESPQDFRALVADGPVAYRSQLPLASWAKSLNQAGIPATVSYHAGTYLCNAILYLSHFIVEQQRLRTQAAFIHLPLSTSQTAQAKKEIASMPTSMASMALRIVVEQLSSPNDSCEAASPHDGIIIHPG